MRGLRLFGSLTVAVAESAEKKPLFPVQERVEMVRESTSGMKGVAVKPFNCLLVDFLRAEKASVVLRGLRETSDFPFEFQHSIVNRVLAPEIETVFVMTNPEHFYVTSSIVKEIAELGGKIDGFVPKPVALALKRKLG